MKAIFINSEAREVREIEYQSVADLRKLVRGSIQLAYLWPFSRDTLYVDEEGLFKNPQTFFSILERPDQLLAGNGVIVGAEEETETGWITRSPVLTVRDVKTRIKWHKRLSAI